MCYYFFGLRAATDATADYSLSVFASVTRRSTGPLQDTHRLHDSTLSAQSAYSIKQRIKSALHPVPITLI